MSITALGYIGVHSSKLDDWSSLATGLLGMQQIDRAGTTRVFRMDDRKQRFVVTGEAGDRLAFTGWETPNAAAINASPGGSTITAYACIARAARWRTREASPI